MSLARFTKSFIELALIVFLASAGVAGISAIIWIWGAIIYPPFDVWLAVKATFWTLLVGGMVYGIADIADGG